MGAREVLKGAISDFIAWERRQYWNPWSRFRPCMAFSLLLRFGVERVGILDVLRTVQGQGSNLGLISRN